MKILYKIFGGILSLLVVAIAALALAIGYTSDCAPSPAGPAPSATSMIAVVYHCYGSVDVLEIAEVEKPQPGDTEVLVRIHAASINPLDWHYMRGSPYIMRLESGLGAPNDPKMGVDFAGTVQAIGASVTKFKPGDEVFGGRTGAFAEYVTVDETRAITLKPANVSFAEAAAVPIAGVTALQALRDKGQLKPGQKVLINGASGGVGTFAVQIAKSFGAQVTGVCSTRNLKMVLSIGADHVIDYTQEDYTESGQKYDVIIDNVGNRSLSENRKVLNPDGILVLVGGPKGNWVGPLMGAIKAPLYSPFVDQDFVLILAELVQDDLAVLAELMQSGKLNPVIDQRYSLKDVTEAIRYSEDGHARGKIIIDME